MRIDRATMRDIEHKVEECLLSGVDGIAMIQQVTDPIKQVRQETISRLIGKIKTRWREGQGREELDAKRAELISQYRKMIQELHLHRQRRKQGICERCNGKGATKESPCKKCEGTGRTEPLSVWEHNTLMHAILDVMAKLERLYGFESKTNINLQGEVAYRNDTAIEIKVIQERINSLPEEERMKAIEYLSLITAPVQE